MTAWNGNEFGINKGNENLKGNISNADYDRSKATEECGISTIWLAL
jgi:hypothetical protein